MKSTNYIVTVVLDYGKEFITEYEKFSNARDYAGVVLERGLTVDKDNSTIAYYPAHRVVYIQISTKDGARIEY